MAASQWERWMREISLPKRGPHVIFTLDPNKLAEKKQQCLHIGNLQSFIPRILLHKQSSSVIPGRPRIHYDYYKNITLSYPPNTKAFLYYTMSSEKPRIAGELRLRVTSSDDPASFESGSDLLRTDGQLWSLQLYTLFSKYYFPLYEKLREERLVSDDLDTVLSTLPSKKFNYRRSPLLNTLNDAFIVNFSSHELTFIVITEQGMEWLPFNKLFYDNREMYKGTPYTGSALARFERSTLLDHKGTRTVVLRFLKIITPVKCVMPLYDDRIRCPKEGELHWRSNNAQKIVQSAWSVDIDKPGGAMIRGLQLLWNT